MGTQNKDRSFRTACRMGDAFRCGLLVDITDGIISRVRPTGPDDPTGKVACQKGLATAELVYHPDRLKCPLKRVGKRGDGQWERIPWDEALDSIALRFKEITGHYGPISIAWMTSLVPELTPLSGAGYSRLMSLMGGTYVDFWGCGDAAGPCADIATFGGILGEPYLTAVTDPKFGIMWGCNYAVTASPFFAATKEAKKKGCKLVVIDPRFTRTGSYADEHITIRPGTDSALALGMIHVILERNLQDDMFIKENTIGPLLVRNDNGLLLRESDFKDGGSKDKYLVLDQNAGQVQSWDTTSINPALRGTYRVCNIECQPAFQLLIDLAKSYSPEKVSEITDVSEETIQNLAIAYATEKPAMISRGWGLQRTFYGDLSARAVNALAAITGNLNLDIPPLYDHSHPSFYKPGGPNGSIPFLSLSEAISKGEPFPIKALWCAGHNFMTTMPDTNKVIRDVLPNLELIVVCDLFMTASARYADYVLPVTSFYESNDIGLFGYFLQLQQKLIEPLHEAKSDFEIAADLGKRMGFGQYFDKTQEQYIEEILTVHPEMEGITLEELKNGPIMVKLPDLPWRLNTPTGRIEFYVERLKEFGQELPIYLEPVESARGESAKDYPLVLLSTHPVNRVHSSMANIPSLQKIDPEPRLEINPSDAELRNVAHGEIVRVFNDRGQLKIRADITNNIKPGVVNVTEGWWPEQHIEGQINNLTHDKKNPAQQHIFQANAAFYDVLVQVEKLP